VILNVKDELLTCSWL